MSFLQEYQGCLQCDAYPGYNGLFARGKVVEVACWAYARRNFVDAAKTSAGVAHEAVARIKGLYAVEHEARDIDSGQRALLRQEKSVPFGRKNWLFFGSDRGGRTLVILANVLVLVQANSSESIRGHTSGTCRPTCQKSHSIESIPCFLPNNLIHETLKLKIDHGVCRTDTSGSRGIPVAWRGARPEVAIPPPEQMSRTK